MAREKKALGTGLGVLFGEDEASAGGETLTLPISKIEPRQDQPRDTFDEEALATLAESISKYGVITPITVRKLDNGYYQIIAGERRWRASRLAGLSEIPVNIMEADDRRTAELALVENLQREDLNPLEEARGYRTLMTDFGLTQDEAAQSVGRSRPAVANALRLLSLSPAVAELVESGQLSAGHARALIPVSDPALQLEAARTIIAKGYSVRKAESLAATIANASGKSEKAAPAGIDYSKELSDELSALLGRKVRLLDGKRTGRIEIEFYGADDREVLISQLRNIK